MNRPALQIKQVGVSRMAFRARKVFGSFEKRAPGPLRSSTELMGVKSAGTCCLQAVTYENYLSLSLFPISYSILKSLTLKTT